MKNLELTKYFESLDLQLKNATQKEIEKYLENEFPNYRHIGKFIDPMNQNNRDYFSSSISNNLNQYSFDPLISFEMNQIKYSTEILHPKCDCFRKRRIKKRPIKTPSHRDRILYASWNNYLSEKHKLWVYTNKLSDSVSAYIPKTGKFNAHFAKLAFDYFQGRDEYSAIALDIKSFFDNISHDILKSNLLNLIKETGGSIDGLNQIDYRLFKATTNYTYIELNDLIPNLNNLDSGDGMYMSRSQTNWKKLRSLNIISKNTRIGIPQGLPCSGVLANISMMDFDKYINEQIINLGGIYIRYADDIFIAAPNKRIASHLFKLCEDKLNEISLPIAEKKTEEFDFTKSISIHPTINYLGLNCTGNRISIRQSGINKFYQKTSQYIYSYVLTCKRRNIEPSRKKIRAIFSHSGKNNYYSYLRRVSKVFEADSRYSYRGIKSKLKNHMNWIDGIFDDALTNKPPVVPGKYKHESRCTCPEKRDG
jgi:hypothetical protein